MTPQIVVRMPTQTRSLAQLYVPVICKRCAPHRRSVCYTRTFPPPRRVGSSRLRRETGHQHSPGHTNTHKHTQRHTPLTNTDAPARLTQLRVQEPSDMLRSRTRPDELEWRLGMSGVSDGSNLGVGTGDRAGVTHGEVPSCSVSSLTRDILRRRSRLLLV